jgi:hypothetical protein
MSVPLMHLVPLIQGLCISGTDASGVLFAMLMAAILGRVAFGKLADLIGPMSARAGSCVSRRRNAPAARSSAYASRSFGQVTKMPTSPGMPFG